ncbi:hypothetical protein BCR33DRAFT_718292 [Rhizoclosmatium globosum]|uniref:Hexosyltransferase n=1 Tax=Rhizoclosmatium globosum TaxID=329046 RepID=A0A1Y2C6D1_9FUNG|nr:hypothetical protein BCR33DRAFT_718292 [Rhizoclosmatium globosum]|eukprot:ORY42603.1 hypothetical protein BCR33DRAFT_718292 [Rhizoclosmatium globosum]
MPVQDKDSPEITIALLPRAAINVPATQTQTQSDDSVSTPTTWKITTAQLRLGAMFLIASMLAGSFIWLSWSVTSNGNSSHTHHLQGTSDLESVNAKEGLKMLFTPSTGLGITDMLFVARNKTAGTHKRVLLAFDFVDEELKTTAQRQLMRVAYKKRTSDVDVVFVVRDPRNNAEDRLFTSEQEINHDLFSLGQTTYERLYEHAHGKPGVLFPQTVVKHLGKEMPHYDFIVLTGRNNIVDLRQLVSLLGSWDSKDLGFAYNAATTTAILSTTLSKALAYPVGNEDKDLSNLAKKVNGSKVHDLPDTTFVTCSKASEAGNAAVIHSCDSLDLKYMALKALQYIDVSDFSAKAVNKFLPSPSLDPKTALFGVFSYSADIPAIRRSLYRFGYNVLQKSPQRNIDIRFVMGVPKTEAQKLLILEEQERHKDILLIDTPENMNDGKSFYYVQQVWWHMTNGTLPKYDFVFKVDDDAYLNLRGIVANITQYDPKESLYFGRGLAWGAESNWYFFGMVYGFTSELTKRIAGLNPEVGHLGGNEDQMMGNMVNKANVTHKIIWNLLDLPDISGAFSVPRTKEVFGVHHVKDYNYIWNEMVSFEAIYSQNRRRSWF